MVKKGDTYFLKESEKANLPTETDPSVNPIAAAEGDKYYVADTGEVGVFLDGEWVAPTT